MEVYLAALDAIVGGGQPAQGQEKGGSDAGLGILVLAALQAVAAAEEEAAGRR